MVNRRVREKNPSVMVGTGRELIQMLNRAPARRTMAITFDDEAHAAAAEAVYRGVAAFLPQLIRTRQQETLEKVVNALLPEIAPSEAAVAQARMLVDARSEILNSGNFVAAGDVARLAGYSASNPSAQPNRWKREGAIFAIHHNGVDYFPLFGLDPQANYRPYKALGEVIEIFQGTRDGWGLAFWFAGLNSFLDDRRPQDLLTTEPDLVTAAARDEMEGLRHG